MIGRPSKDEFYPSQNITSIFHYWVNIDPDRHCLIFPASHGKPGKPRYLTITYGQLAEAAWTLSAKLNRAGVVRGDRVLLLQPLSPDLFQALIAVIQIGAVAVLVNPFSSLGQVGEAARRTAARVMIGGWKAQFARQFSRPLRALPHSIWSRPNWRNLAPATPSSAGEIATMDAGDLAMISFTSGTTGSSKAIHRTHGHMNTQGDILSKALPRAEGDIDLPFLPNFAINNMGEGVPTVFPAIGRGRKVTLDPALILRQIVECQVRTLGGSPSYLESLADHCQTGGCTVETVRGIICGGAAVSAALLTKLECVFPAAKGNIKVLYGATEADPISFLNSEEITTEMKSAMISGAGYCVGNPIADIEVTRAPGTDDNITVMGRIYVRGEIVVSGPHVVGNRGSMDDANQFSTGDAGYLDEHGRLWLLGRMANRINVQGRNIDSFQVEPVIESLEYVRRCALLKHNDDVVLAVELRTKNQGGAEEQTRWKASIEQVCFAANIPVDRVTIVDRIPVDSQHRAKIQYDQLRKSLR